MEAKARLASTVLWRVENLLSMYSDPEEHFAVNSATFALNNLGENQWQLRLVRSDRCQIGLFLRHVSECVDIEIEWSLLNPDGSHSFQKVTHDNLGGQRRLAVLFPNTDGGNALDEEPLFVGKETVTLRLRIRKRNVDFDQAEHVKLVTRVLQEPQEEHFVWRIEGFSSLQLNAKAVATVHLRGHPFTLCVFLTGESLIDSHLNLSVYSENSPKQVVKLTISVFGKETECLKARHQFRSSTLGQTWLLPRLESRRRILERPSDWLVGDILAFLCQFECDYQKFAHYYIESADIGPDCSATEIPVSKAAEQYREIVTTVEEEAVQTTLLSSERRDVISQPRKASKSALLNDLMYLFDMRVLSDFELRAGADSFPVHKNILCARSLFFRDMFCGDVKGEIPKSFDVSDLDVSTLAMFLIFLYVGQMPYLQWETALKLCYAAGKYRVPSLRQRCVSVLQCGLTPSNVSDVLELADRLQDQELRSCAFDFIQNNFDAVVMTEEWDEFLERSYLAGKTMKEVYEKRIHTKTW